MLCISSFSLARSALMVSTMLARNSMWIALSLSNGIWLLFSRLKFPSTLRSNWIVFRYRSGLGTCTSTKEHHGHCTPLPNGRPRKKLLFFIFHKIFHKVFHSGGGGSSIREGSNFFLVLREPCQRIGEQRAQWQFPPPPPSNKLGGHNRRTQMVHKTLSNPYRVFVPTLRLYLPCICLCVRGAVRGREWIRAKVNPPPPGLQEGGGGYKVLRC